MKKKILSFCMALAISSQMFAGQVFAADATTGKEVVSEDDYAYVTAQSEEQAAVDDPEYLRATQGASDDFYSEDEELVGTTNTTSPYTGGGYNHNSRFDGYTIANGIDVSKYQKTIDWAAVKAAGVEYAFIRVGYRGYTSGSLAADEFYDQNMKGAINAGIKVGVYFYSQAITEAEGVDEANYILSRIGSYKISLPLVIDYEFAGSKLGRLYDAHLSQDGMTAVCNAFSRQIAAAGYTPMTYANKSMLQSSMNASALTSDVWLANYTSETTYAGAYQFWQYSSKAKVSGISGDVDVNFWYQEPTSSSSSSSSSTSSGNTSVDVIGANADQKTDSAVTSMRVYNADGTMLVNDYYCDGTYTYYMQADGSPMTNRLTWDPEGTGLIYFDAKGHMVFDAFQYCKDVGYTCYFNSLGRVVFDHVTFYKDNVYYLDATGAVVNGGWFRFANGVDIGFANANGTLFHDSFSYDQWGRVVYFQGNGALARGLINDGTWYYVMNETDGHCEGQFR